MGAGTLEEHPARGFLSSRDRTGRNRIIADKTPESAEALVEERFDSKGSAEVMGIEADVKYR